MPEEQNFTIVSPSAPEEIAGPALSDAKEEKEEPRCCVSGCDTKAEYEVIFYDVYFGKPVDVFYEQHNDCAYLCGEHQSENEHGAQNDLDDPALRRYRGRVDYPYTKSWGRGFVIYRRLK